MILHPLHPQGAPPRNSANSPPPKPILGLDIGGANLKAADGAGFALSRPFPLWRTPDELAPALADLIAAAPTCERLAVTMTGELADCFPTKRVGVSHILQSVQHAAGGRASLVYLVDGRLVSMAEALASPHLAAASNWHALATFAAGLAGDGAGLLVDIGSTTTDILPILHGVVASDAVSDVQRLLAGQLVYTGASRSPVCAVLQRAPYRGGECGLAQELFATMRDVYLVLGPLDEAPEDCDTADGRPATRRHAIARLGRLLCCDEEEFSAEDAAALAAAAAAAQEALIGAAMGRVLAALPKPPAWIVASGAGEFLVRRLVDRLPRPIRFVSLAEALGPAVSSCAAAHAVAVIAQRSAFPLASPRP